MSDQNWSALEDEAHGIWNQNAAFWDDYMQEGNDFQRLLIAPTVERLLAPRAGEHVLDVACGNGNFARRLAKQGVHMTAVDFSEVFVERARARGTTFEAGTLVYRVVNATKREQLLALGEGHFDALTCNMALMDMAEIDPLLQSVPRLLKPGGRFVFSVSHPCFNSAGITKLAEVEDREGELVTSYAVKVLTYLTPVAHKGLGVVGQPAAHYYFHRPLSVLLNACFDAGLVLDRMEEPRLRVQAMPNRPFSWANNEEIPPVLVARLRPA